MRKPPDGGNGGQAKFKGVRIGMITKERQIRSWFQKIKQQVMATANRTDRDYIIVMWLGVLNGLRLTNAITLAEYNNLYTDISDFASTLDAEQEGVI